MVTDGMTPTTGVATGTAAGMAVGIAAGMATGTAAGTAVAAMPPATGEAVPLVGRGGCGGVLERLLAPPGGGAGELLRERPSRHMATTMAPPHRANTVAFEGERFG